MSKRREVYAAIDGERGYQDKRWGPGRVSVPAYLTYMRHWLTRAEQEITKNNNDVEALHSIRKITALGVACMEEHDAIPRME